MRCRPPAECTLLSGSPSPARYPQSPALPWYPQTPSSPKPLPPSAHASLLCTRYQQTPDCPSVTCPRFLKISMVPTDTRSPALLGTATCDLRRRACAVRPHHTRARTCTHARPAHTRHTHIQRERKVEIQRHKCDHMPGQRTHDTRTHTGRTEGRGTEMKSVFGDSLGRRTLVQQANPIGTETRGGPWEGRRRERGGTL